MFLLGSARSSWTYCCIPCRRVSKVEVWPVPKCGMSSMNCPSCKLPMKNMGARWCPPKKNNHKAWREIANGNVMWDSSRVAKQGLRGHYRRARLGKY
jgi:hypothetical protein